MTVLFRLGSSVRALLLGSMLLSFLLAQQGSWLHALSHVAHVAHVAHAEEHGPHALAMSHSEAGRSSPAASQATPTAPATPVDADDTCLSCLAFSAGGHAAPLFSVPTWQAPALAMAWLGAVATGRAVQAFLPYQSRAPPCDR